MNVFYCPGGGYGHVTRAIALSETLGLAADQCCLITQNPFVEQPQIRNRFHCIQIPDKLIQDPKQLAIWLDDTLAHLDAHRFLIDAFPFGPIGELHFSKRLPSIPLSYIARALNWAAYRAFTASPPFAFELTYQIENLEGEHLAFIKQYSRQITQQELLYPIPPIPHHYATDLARIKATGQPIWLIAHSGQAAEQTELVTYALERARLDKTMPALILVSPQRPPNLDSTVIHWSLYPARSLFHEVEKIFTAGGFNSLAESKAFASKRHSLPFPRRYDNQARRIASLKQPFV